MPKINPHISTGNSNCSIGDKNVSGPGKSELSGGRRSLSSFQGLSARQSISSASCTLSRVATEGLFPQHQTPRSELPHKKGNCGSAPQVSGSRSPSAGSSSSGSPARPSTSVFEYRTAELSGANVNGICVGLTAEWLADRHGSAAERMAALTPGSGGHTLAAQRQEQYQAHKDDLRHHGMRAPQADLEAQNAVLREAGLSPSGSEKIYDFNDPVRARSLFEKIAKDGSTQLLSLYFSEGGAHTVATSTSNRTTTLFDPNYGEFEVASNDVESLFQSLSNRYKNPNGQHLSTVTTQRM